MGWMGVSNFWGAVQSFRRPLKAQQGLTSGTHLQRGYNAADTFWGQYIAAKCNINRLYSEVHKKVIRRVGWVANPTNLQAV